MRYLAISIWLFLFHSLFAQDLLIGTHAKAGDQGFYGAWDKLKSLKISKLLDRTGTSIVLQRGSSSVIYTCGVGDQGEDGLIHCFDLKSGELLKTISSGDSRPCYLSLSKCQKFLFVANIRNGSVCSFKLCDKGVPLVLISTVKVKPITKRFAPHACVVSPEGKFLFVPDISGNRLCRLKIDNGVLSYMDSLYSEYFTGPRHITFDPIGKSAYLVNQMGEAVSILSYKSGKLSFVKNVQSLPSDQLNINNHIAEIKIHPSGKFVYASNRGHDSLVLYQRDLETGMLTYDQCFSSGGEAPWSFAISSDGAQLFCSNNMSNNLVRYKIEQETGAIYAKEEVLKVANPCCVVYVK